MEVYNQGVVVEILKNGRIVVEWTSVDGKTKIKKDYSKRELSLVMGN